MSEFDGSFGKTISDDSSSSDIVTTFALLLTVQLPEVAVVDCYNYCQPYSHWASRWIPWQFGLRVPTVSLVSIDSIFQLF